MISKIIRYIQHIKSKSFDDCSQLDISYMNTRFSDNYNTQPEEKLSITFSMDYLSLGMNNQQIYFKNLETQLIVIRLFIFIFY